MPRKRESQEIPGSRTRIAAADVAAMLGLKEKLPPGPPVPLSPAQQRQRESGQKITPIPEECAPTTVVIPAGRPILDFWGLRGENIPIELEQELGPRKKPPRRHGWSQGDDATVSTDEAADIAAEADELRQRYRDHAAEVAARAESARGDAAKEAAAAAEVREVASIGERLKSKLEKLGTTL